MRGIQCIPGDVATRSKPDPRHRDEMKGEKDTDGVVPPAGVAAPRADFTPSLVDDQAQSI